MVTAPPAVLSHIVRQHADDAVSLYAARTALAKAPHATLEVLRRFDERLAAHLDGLSLASDFGLSICDELFETPTPGAVFAAAVVAIVLRRHERLERMFLVTEAAADSVSGLVSALGWVEPGQLHGVAANLIASSSAHRRALGLAACSAHRVSPPETLWRWVTERTTVVQARALRLVGQIGDVDSLPACMDAMNGNDADCRFWAARSAVLLGNRGVALEALTNTAAAPSAYRGTVFPLVLQAMTTTESHRLLQQLASHPEQLRWVIQGSGVAGDAAYVPWLIQHMAHPLTARVAGEAFALITGADIEALNLDTDKPEKFESGPNDDPDDLNVDMDPDEGLPWPRAVSIAAWWSANSSRFHPGRRYFLGAPLTREHCLDVLKNGYQRQRILAAHYLCLLNPGTPLFNTSAPAWRQQRLLAEMK